MSESPISHIRAGGAPLLIRADAGGTLGTGHVMRMIALAQAWMAQGGNVVMALLSCPEPLLERLKNEGIETRTLEGVPRGTGDDAGQLIVTARNVNPAWVVLDGYDFDLNYQRLIKKAGFKLMVMDDYGHCSRWCADLILNQNLGAESRTYDNEVANAKTLLGSNYVLLRKEFWNVSSKAAASDKPIQNLLITLGGVDADNITGKVLQALENATTQSLHLRVILGPGNPHLSALKTLAHTSQHDILLLQNITDMPEQYSWADAVISAGGSTCYEWMRFGLPAAVLLVADNQRSIFEFLTSSGRAANLGSALKSPVNLDPHSVQSWLDHPPRGASKRTSPVDGAGSLRVGAMMMESPVYLRPACEQDVQDFFLLANDPKVRETALNTAPIGWDTHVSWFNRKVKDTSACLFAACSTSDDSFVGQVRFEYDQHNHWIISYSLHEKIRGRGLGKGVLLHGMRLLHTFVKTPVEIVAVVNKSNIPSRRIFTALEFSLVQENTLPSSFVSYTRIFP